MGQGGGGGVGGRAEQACQQEALILKEEGDACPLYSTKINNLYFFKIKYQVPYLHCVHFIIQ